MKQFFGTYLHDDRYSKTKGFINTKRATAREVPLSQICEIFRHSLLGCQLKYMIVEVKVSLSQVPV